MKRTRSTESPARDFLKVLWQAPLLAVPFGLFFLITSGQPFRALPQFYLVSLVFGGFALTGVWVAHHWVVPPVIARRAADPHSTLLASGLHAALALLFGLAAAIVIHFTIVPGFLGSGRAVLQVLTYFVLFAMLFVGIAMAVKFQRRAVERAASERELQLARRIQKSFLLSEFPLGRRIEVYATNLSSKEVSGDFYDVIPLGEDGILIAIADVSGKGVPAALLSSMLQASLRTQAASDVRVSAMMARINALVCGRAETGQFATFFLAAVSERDLTLRFTNAGHNFPILFRSGGERQTLETGGLIVGIFPDAAYEEECVALAPGERVVLYTDGVTEATREDGEAFGEERLAALVESLPRELAAREVVEGVLGGLRDFLGEAEAEDDVTVVALRVRDGAAEA